MIQEVRELILLFTPLCKDTETMERLLRMLDDRGAWAKARDLFNDVRTKTLRAGKSSDHQAEVQYAFEEVCAKTLYNLTRQPAPYDPDAPYWIVPNALALARELGIDALEVVGIVTRRAY